MNIRNGDTDMRGRFGTALRLLITMTVLTGIIYPVIVTGIARALFSGRAGGSLIRRGDDVVGSELLGQKFTQPGYFHGRPSACDYETVPGGADNLGPTSAALLDSVTRRRAAFSSSNNLPAGTSVPADMLFASGSGLDPHISPEAAELQIGRIAAERRMDSSEAMQLESLVKSSVELPQFLVLGQPRVNVLLLNLKLDQIKPMH